MSCRQLQEGQKNEMQAVRRRMRREEEREDFDERRKKKEKNGRIAPSSQETKN